MMGAPLTGEQLLETCREGRRYAHLECCIEHFTALIERGVLPFKHMGGMIARSRLRSAYGARLAECVPCPAHCQTPPSGWVWVPSEHGTSAIRIRQALRAAGTAP